MRGVNTCCCLGALIGLAMIGVMIGIFTIKKSFNEATETETELKQIHVLFAHGERTPLMEEIEMYPMNKYRHEGYYPHGYNALTNSGKMKTFNIGEKLRDIYDDFIGKIYKHEVSHMQASDTDISKMGALLFLAGLWPAEKSQMWTNMIWQPIPYKNPAFDKDYMLYEHNCPRYLLEKKYVTELFLEKMSPYYRNLFQRLSIYTGYNYSIPYDVLRLANLLDSQVKFRENITMIYPEWFINMKESIEKIIKSEYNIMFHNSAMQRLSAGPLLQRMIHHSKNSIENDKIGKQSLKMYLYSGTINNIASILATVEKKLATIPSYGSMLVMELHYRSILKDYLVKLIYWDGATSKSRVLELSSDKDLTIENFEFIFSDILRVDYEEDCKV